MFFAATFDHPTTANQTEQRTVTAKPMLAKVLNQNPTPLEAIPNTGGP